MEDVMFVIKCLIMTVVIVVCLRIRVGSRTVEGHMMSWIHHSSVSNTLQDVAEGAVKAATKSKEAVSDFVGSHAPTTDVSMPTEASSGWFKIKRSAAYYRQKERDDQLKNQRHAERERAQADESDQD